MFCPQCKKKSEPSDPASAAQPAPTERRRRFKATTTCSQCGGLLADDRLLPEFTVAAEIANPAPAERPLSVKEVLKAIAGPHPIGQYRVKETAPEQLVEPTVHSSRRNTDTGRFSELDWHRTDSPVIPRGYGRPRRTMTLQIIACVGSATALVMFLISAGLHMHGRQFPAPAMSPAGTIVMPSARIVHDGTYTMRVIGANHGHAVYNWVKTPNAQPPIAAAPAAAVPLPLRQAAP